MSENVKTSWGKMKTTVADVVSSSVSNLAQFGSSLKTNLAGTLWSTATSGVKGLATAFEGLAAKGGAALLTLVTNPLVWVAGAIAAIIYFTQRTEALNEVGKQTAQTLKDLNTAMGNQDLSGVEQGIEKLKQEQAELDKIQSKIQNNNGTDPISIGSKVKAIWDYKDRVDEDKANGLTIDSNGKIDLSKYNDQAEALKKVDVAQRELNAAQSDSDVAKLLSEYSNLSKLQDKGGAEQERQAQVVTELQRKFGDLTVEVDKNGNTIIKNTDVLEQHASALAIDAQNATMAKNAQQQLADKMDQSLAKVDDYAKYIKEMNSNSGHLSANSMQQLIKDHMELAPYLTNEQELYQKIQEAINDEKNTATETYQQMMAQNDDYYASHGELKNAITGYVDDIYAKYSNYFSAKAEDLKKEVSNAKNAADAEYLINSDLLKKKAAADKEYLTAKTRAESKALGAFFTWGKDAQGNTTLPASAMGQNFGDFQNNFVDQDDATKKAKAQVDATQKAIDDITSGLDKVVNSQIQMPDALQNIDSTTEGLNKNTKAAKENTQSLKEQKQQMAEDSLSTKDYDNRLAELNLTLKEYDNQLQNVNQHSQDAVNILNKKADVLKQQIALTKQQIELDNKLAAQYQKMGVQTFTEPDTSASYSSSTTPTSSSGGNYNGKYSSYINTSAQKYGVDPALIAAIIQNESGWNPNVVSSAGAKGLMQKMEGTNLFDPASNIDQGTAELARDLKMFNGNISLALAAYNAGPGNVQKYGGIPPFAETQAYVPKVLASYKQYSNGKQIPNTGVGTGSSNDEYTQKQESINYQEYALRAKQNALGLQSNLLDMEQQLLQIPYQQFEAYVGMYDDKIDEISKKADIFKNTIDTLDKSDSGKRIDLMWKQYDSNQSKLNTLNQEAAYIQNELTNNAGKYTQGSLQQMRTKLLEVQDAAVQTKVAIKDAYEATYDEAYNSRVQQIKEDLEDISGKINAIKNTGNENQDEVKLYESTINKLNQQLQIAQGHYNEVKRFYDVTKDPLLKVAAEEQLIKFGKTVSDIQGQINSNTKTMSDLIGSLTIKLLTLEQASKEVNSSVNIDKIDQYKQSIDEINDTLTTTSNLLNQIKNKMDILKTQNDYMGQYVQYADQIKEMNNQLSQMKENSSTLQDTLSKLKKSFQENFGQDITQMSKEDFNDLYSKEFASRVFNDKAEEDAFNKRKELFKELEDAYNSLTQSIEQNTEDQLSMQNQILQAQQEQKDTILNAAKSLQDEFKQMYQQEINDEKTALDKRLKNIQDFISQKAKALNSDWDEEDYNKDVQKQQENIDKLQAQINAMSRDTSEAGRMAVKNLQDQLKDLQDNLDTTKENRGRDLIKQDLQDQSDQYQKEAEAQKQALDDEYTQEKLNIISRQALQDGYFTDLNGKIQDTKTAMSDWLKTTDDGLSVIGDKLQNELIHNLEQVQDIISSYGYIMPQLDATDQNTELKLEDMLNNQINGVDLSTYMNNSLLGGLGVNLDHSIQGTTIPKINTQNQSNSTININVDKLVGVDGNVYDKGDLLGLIDQGAKKVTSQIFKGIESN